MSSLFFFPCLEQINWHKDMGSVRCSVYKLEYLSQYPSDTCEKLGSWPPIISEMIGDRYRISLEVHGPAVYHGKHSRYLVSIKMCKVPEGQFPRLSSDFHFHKVCVLSQHTYPHMHINANMHTYANTERCK